MDVDIDNEFDGKFLDQFRSMGTTDRDVLISQFQSVLGNSINPELCAFFLDMNNWNLQNALGSYYDFEQPLSALPSMSIVADLTIGEGEAVAPNTSFHKSWRIKNSGNERWPPCCHLRFCSGDNLSCVERKIVDPLSPGETTDVSVEMKSPPGPGSYLSLWRLTSPTGVFFGDVLNVHVEVADCGLLGLTQQLSRIGSNPGAQCGERTTTAQQVNISTVTTSTATTTTQVPPQSATSILQQQEQQQQVQFQVIPQDSSVSKFHNSSLPAQGEEDADMS